VKREKNNGIKKIKGQAHMAGYACTLLRRNDLPNLLFIFSNIEAKTISIKFHLTKMNLQTLKL